MKSIEEYRRELLNFATRNSAGSRELFAEDSLKEEPQTTLTGSGWLVVELTHSKGLYPVANARVCVSDMQDKSLGCKITDESGKTAAWQLSAPPKLNSETPSGNKNNVSSFYNIKIEADGYLPVIIKGVPVFDGVRTLQPLDMFFLGAAESTEPRVIKFNNSYNL